MGLFTASAAPKITPVRNNYDIYNQRITLTAINRITTAILDDRSFLRRLPTTVLPFFYLILEPLDGILFGTANSMPSSDRIKWTTSTRMLPQQINSPT
jgi:hypothetical protein